MKGFGKAASLPVNVSEGWKRRQGYSFAL